MSVADVGCAAAEERKQEKTKAVCELIIGAAGTKEFLNTNRMDVF